MFVLMAWTKEELSWKKLDAHSALSRRLESTETQGDGKHMLMDRHMPCRSWIDHSCLESGSKLILVTDLLCISIVLAMDNQRSKSHLEARRAIGSSRLYRAHLWQWERCRQKAIQAFREACSSRIARQTQSQMVWPVVCSSHLTHLLH